VTTVLDAEPLQVLRVQGPTWITAVAAAGLGGVFVLSVWKLWWLTLASGIVFFVALIWWLWTGAAEIPEKQTKDIGGGKRLPLYRAGVTSTGWWAMFITMTGDLTAYLSLVFGYFFFWTIHEDFPPVGVDGPGWVWPLIASILIVAAWAMTLGARVANAAERVVPARWLLVAGMAVSAGAAASLLAGPWTTGLDPTSHAYPAIVWALAVWSALHLGVGVIMQAYCLARSIFGRMTPKYDADLWNVTLYWHFAGFCALVTAAVIGGFPLLS
jgi:cytochrome c oxidase subunit I+III